MEYINMDKRFKISKTLITNIIFLLVFIVAISAQTAGFGFDSANSCSTQGTKLSRRGRAQMLATIPCDLTRQAYCHLPGSAYPWHAVRRFVHENHGLMKRMYGDVKHISVLRDEILNNEIDVDDVEVAAERYSKEPHRARAAKYMQAPREEYGSIKNNDVVMEPHFRPVSTTTTTTTAAPDEIKDETGSTTSEASVVEAKMEAEERPVKPPNGALRRRINGNSNGGGHRRRVNVYVNRNRPTHSSLRRRTTTTTTTEEPPSLVENVEQPGELILHEETILAIPEDDGNLASNSVYEIPTLQDAAMHIGDNIQIIESPQLGQMQKPLTEERNNSETATISTTLKVVSTPATNMRPAAGAIPASPAPVAPTPLQQQLKPQVERQRPGQQPSQKLKLQQVNKPQPTNADTSGIKESSILKSKPTNESERPQTATAIAPVYDNNNSAATQTLKAANDDTDVTTDADNGATLSSIGATNANAATDVTTTVTATATATATLANNAQLKYELTKNKNQQFNGENKAELPAAATTVEQTPPTTVATKLTSTQAELSSAAKTTSAPSVATTGAEAAPSAPHTELLAGEKIQRPQLAPQRAPQATPAQTTPVSAAAAASTKPVLRDGQLYQDALKQEVKPAPNMRGINACPVKEEVVAPFWANNTRGEVLALLNLYPFEQYVHWEKCTHENRQMYCREGCRCEQQYRLHRLLAYDPHNECRGIFSDWFRFPSCCICKCYGIPSEFRATSRSPRSERMDDFETVAEESDFDDDNDGAQAEDSMESVGDQHSQHPLDVAERLVRQAIYEHATEDWYRPKDEFDFYEG
ncbi:protein spaetzle 4 [Bactrocera dorsalis]|uniref:Protein spaetzle 4 n=1 Tax=Bactrocera dorsalis TaxID=27457 RepID=A0A8N4L313_BACDO|nr:protein spaetzle 4 [Bactrocera dorsalis]